MRAFKLKFHSAIHIDSKGSGEPETADEFIHSDTLSAALCLAWSAVYPETGSDFFLKPPFTVSSAFPYIASTYLFPVPRWNFWKDMEPKAKKQAKAVRWVSQNLFAHILSGDLIDFKETKIISNVIALSKSEVSDNPEFRDMPAWAITERQRISVDRLGLPSTGGLFFFALQFFAPESGLYFLVDVADAKIAKLKAAMDYLGDSGIGADRNSGLGHFRVVEEQELDIRLPVNPGRWITLSLFNPGPDDDINALVRKSAYDLMTRSGWISNSTIGRPPVRVFTEGSLFSQKPVGRIVSLIDDATRDKFDLKISHSAPRDFRAISLPCAEPYRFKEKSK